MCFGSLMTKEYAVPGITRQWAFRSVQKHQLFKVLAWHYHQKEQRHLTHHDLLKVITELLPAINLPAERNHDILQDIKSEQGVSQDQAAGWHGFLHVTLQEYFAAAYINDQVEDQCIEPAELLRHRAESCRE